ncbi:hypothetical protein AVV12_gp40 [Streptomyces phage SF3]|uniref:Uncharacterized protein n=1 Tax=Streptomyces phage SF3 TaxID=1690818 RepID=A0A0M3UK51_9CAUD|nr:hypothetical protein AVV12_gp40 [Streptomyces phage SF3]ALF00171.1 hypothetical protein SF3_400 [Streptomyces phage SF3]
MCICVRYAPRRELDEPYDAARGLITIPSELRDDRYALRAVRAVLAELCIPQEEHGALCWCGEPIRLPRVPQQRQNAEVINSDA